MTRPVDVLRRRAGLAVPLCALDSETGFGIGDTAALTPFFGWMREAGFTALQLLPLNDLGPGDSCPYAGLSALGLDALAYISPSAVFELRGRPVLDAALRKAAPLRRARRVRFEAVRALKRELLSEAFTRFERSGSGERKERFGRFCGANSDWLADYALFRALKEDIGWRPWEGWEEGLRERDGGALAAARTRLSRAVRFNEWLQWTMHSQWLDVRRIAREKGILLFGDLPFGLAMESADVWARRGDYDFSATMGAPPDKYSETGQDWSLPAYRWDRMEEGGHAWWRRRLRQAGELFDLYRLDHAIGFFRTWQVRGGPDRNRFDSRSDDEARERGRRFFAMARAAGSPAAPVAEDLGLVPSYMPATLAELEVPGYRIIPWNLRADGTFSDPAAYPALSVATLSNHDMPPFARWWGESPREVRDAFWRMAARRDEPAPPLRGAALKTALDTLYRAGSALAITQIQDVFGSRHRINVPGTVTPRNWSYRLPFTVEALTLEPRPRETARMLRSLAEAHGRL